jgi:hypothetical protein
MDEWNIGIEPWIIEDGNYDHFINGETREFAVEFHGDLEIIKSPRKSAEHIRDATYKLSAEVIFSNNDILILDCGLLIFREQIGKIFEVGSYVTGQITLGVDPFFYFEELNKIPDVPSLIYTWKIETIDLLASKLKLVDGKISSGVVQFEDELSVQLVNSTNSSPKNFKYYFVNEDRTIKDHKDGSKAGGLVPSHLVSFCMHCKKLTTNPKKQPS